MNYVIIVLFIFSFFHYNNIAGMIVMMAIVLMFMMMYRNPAVALMPDITPKPLRAKANGIINIMGYLGGAFATVMGLFLVLTNYINVEDSARNLWTIEIPFIVASVLMVISAFVLFFTVKENRLADELRDEMEQGERLAAIENPVNDDAPMSKANKRMLLAILAAEFLWFMADNAVGTYIGNYVIYYLKSASSATSLLVIAGGAASVAGFAIAGIIADKIGRKRTVSIGLSLSVVALIIMCFAAPTNVVTGKHGEFSLPVILYAVWVLKGFGMALVHNCSFPMVVELCSSKKIGRFTGFYDVDENQKWGLGEPYYDYLYIKTAFKNLSDEELEQLASYDAFTDIEFNPARSLNCQARAAAIYRLLRASDGFAALADMETWLRFHKEHVIG